MNKEKMMKVAKGLSIFAKVIQILLTIALVAIAVSIVLISVINPDSISSNSSFVEKTLELGNVVIKIAEPYARDFTINKPVLLGTLLVSFIGVGLTWFELKVARDILEPMKEGNPFETSIGKKIRVLARIELFAGLALMITEWVTSYFVNYESEIMNLFKEGVVESVTVNNSFSLNFVIIAFILYLVSYVFEYGEQLQIESDETL